MLDITNYKNEISSYGGSEIKTTYFIDGHKYMVKFPDPIREKNKKISYVNNQFSEYVGCQIFKLFNIDVQETQLVTCNVNGKNKIAVACKDFLKEGEELRELKNISYSLNYEKKYTSSIEDIYEMINLLPGLDNKNEVISQFWQRFIIDTLLGNCDRHLGNWGFIKKDNKYRLSPVYDCGSCLNPLLNDEEMKRLLENPTELKNIAYNVKTAYKLKGKPVSYTDVYTNIPNDLKKELKIVYPNINLAKIKETIDNINSLSDTKKEFYYKTISLRKKILVDPAYKKITKEN